MNVAALIDLLAKSVLQPLLFFVLFSSPLILLGFLLHRRKRRYQSESNEPFTDLPIRPPGESLRAKIETLSEKYDEALFGMALAAAVAAGMVIGAPPGAKIVTAAGGGIVCVFVYVWLGRRMFKTQRELWAYRLGFTGERVVGEELNQLLARGYRVFHDLPFDGFNIDHVVVGRCGVFAIETKTRRKRSDIAGTPKATVTYDGYRLVFPRNQGESWLRQAKRNADTLAEWLSSATGEKVTAQAVLTIPGWWVERTCDGPFEVEVFNPKKIPEYLSNQPPRLNADAMQRVVHQLTEKCRLSMPS